MNTFQELMLNYICVKIRCIKFGWLRENGKKEISFINKNNKPKTIANNEDNYYPTSMSRAMSHKD